MLGEYQTRFSVCRESFGTGKWSFSGPGSQKKRYYFSEDSPQGVWDNMAERMMLEFAESECPVFRATSPLSRGKLRSKGHGKLLIHYAADLGTIETFPHNGLCNSAHSLRSSRGNV